MRLRPEDWRPQGVDELEAAAWDALRETSRSVLVTAGAGAGKTEFLAQKAAFLLQTGACPAPRRILAISFKRDAAATLGARVARRCPDRQGRRFVSMTFDGFAKGLLDQFRDALPDSHRPPADYSVFFPRDDDYRHFLSRNGVNDLNGKQFADLLAETALLSDAAGENEQAAIIGRYWEEAFEGAGGCRLSFAMINRLAELLLRTVPAVRSVVRSTYPIVFLDECQDTTAAQFQLLETAFDPLAVRFTAVGDGKQRIMGWAGALSDAFADFGTFANARHVELGDNWRSNPELVAIQNNLAQHLDRGCAPSSARRGREVAGDVCAVWDYRTIEGEARGLARWIADEVRAGIPPEQIAVLVRVKSKDTAELLEPHLDEHGIRLRDAARMVGDIAIQDLLAEDLTSLLVPILRLGSVDRDPDLWSRATERLRLTHGIDRDDDDAQDAMARGLGTHVRFLRTLMRDNEPGPSTAAQAVALTLASIGERLIRQATPGYARDADFSRVRVGFDALLAECCEGAPTWQDVLDRFEGLSQVPVMTIHKSKGMEFHTVILHGLDQSSWRGLRPGRGEELRSLFVAVTRARQRAFLSSCAERGVPIRWLDAGPLGGMVPRIAGPRHP